MKRLLWIGGLLAGVAYFLRNSPLRNRVSGLLGRGENGSSAPQFDQTRMDVTADTGSIDDVTLARKVESEIFRDAEVPKGNINVNAEYGVVYLRGEVESPDLIRDLEERTRQVQGVNDVRNLLHTRGEPAPMKEE